MASIYLVLAAYLYEATRFDSSNAYRRLQSLDAHTHTRTRKARGTTQTIDQVLFIFFVFILLTTASIPGTFDSIKSDTRVNDK